MNTVIIEFHNMMASLGTFLWSMVQEGHIVKKDNKAWESTLTQIQELVQHELSAYGYTSYKWDRRFDKIFITPLRDGKPPQIKKKDNLEHYEKEKENLDKFRIHMEHFFIENVPRIYFSQLRK